MPEEPVRPATVVAAVRSVLPRVTATRPRVWILTVTGFLGVAVPVLFAAAGDAGDRTFAAVSAATLSLMSIPLPFLGALLAGDLHRPNPEHLGELQDRAGLRMGAVVIGAALLALAVGVFGAVTSALAVTASSDGSTDAWHDAGVIGVGCLLVALVAQLVGTGFGLLIRNPVLACAATVVVPLDLWLLLGVGVLKPAQAWLTPFPSVQHLLSGDMSGLAWQQWTVMALLWGGGLNSLGAARLRRRWSRLAKPAPYPATKRPQRRRSWPATVTVIATVSVAALTVPLVSPDRDLDAQLETLRSGIALTHDVFDNLSSASHSPYGPIDDIEVRARERRSILAVLVGQAPSAIIVLHTQRGLVVERISCRDLELGRFATLHHVELGPSEIPAGILTDAERTDHRTAFQARGGTPASYTTGGYDG